MVIAVSLLLLHDICLRFGGAIEGLVNSCYGDSTPAVVDPFFVSSVDHVGVSSAVNSSTDIDARRFSMYYLTNNRYFAELQETVPVLHYNCLSHITNIIYGCQ